MSELKVMPPSTDMVLSMEKFFEPFREQAAEWMEKAKAIEVTDVSQTENMEAAKTARLALRKIRTGAEAKHKELKEESLKTGQMLDKIKRELVGMIEPIEALLKEKEEFAEVQAYNEKQRLRKERSDILRPFFGTDTDHMQLGEMNANVFDSLLAGARASKRQKEEEAAEAARLKAEADQKHADEEMVIRAENAKLREQNERVIRLTSMGFRYDETSTSFHHEGIQWGVFKEKVNKMTPGEFDDLYQVKSKEILAHNKAKFEADLAEKTRLDKEKLKQDEKLKKERTERKRLEDEAAAKLAEEEAEKKKKEAEERKAKRAPDKTKLLAAAAEIALIGFLPVSSEEAKKVVEDAKALLAKVVKYISDKAEGL